MGENQSVDGHRWNVQFNYFLSALGWQQLGDSRIDILGADGKKRGVDSVFYYEDPLHESRREGFLVEAKRYSWDNSTPSELQNWYNDMLDCLDHLPRSPDFIDKYSPPQPTRFISGILAIWHHDNYRHETFQQRLERLELPRRRQPRSIYVVSNWTILRVAAVLDEVKRLSAESDVREIEFFFPHRATPRPIQGMTVPIEYLVSKYMFVTRRRLVTDSNFTRPVEEKLVFYFGSLDRKSLEFVHHVSNQIQIANNPVIVYCSDDIYEYRSQIEDFRRTHNHYEIRQLHLSTQIPEWLTREY
jgi:hypothetical protein